MEGIELLLMYAVVMTLAFIWAAIKKPNGVSREEYNSDMDRYAKVVEGYKEELEKSQQMVIKLLTEKAEFSIEKSKLQNEILDLKYPESRKKIIP